MAHKKGAGSTKNGRDSNAKRLGVKCCGGQVVKAGNILISSKGVVKLGDFGATGQLSDSMTKRKTKIGM